MCEVATQKNYLEYYFYGSLKWRNGMTNWKVGCVVFMLIGACNGYGVDLPVADAASQFSGIADQYIFRGRNIEKAWMKQLRVFFKEIDRAIAKMPKSGLSNLSKTNQDLIGAGKIFILGFSTLFFDALNGNKKSRALMTLEYLKLGNVSASLKPKTGIISGDANKTVEIKKSLQRVLEILEKMYCHTFPENCQ
jgi:hypothetical protein